MLTTQQDTNNASANEMSAKDNKDCADIAKEMKQQMQLIRLSAAETEVEKLRKMLKHETDAKLLLQTQLSSFHSFLPNHDNDNANDFVNNRQMKGKVASRTVSNNNNSNNNNNNVDVSSQNIHSSSNLSDDPNNITKVSETLPKDTPGNNNITSNNNNNNLKQLKQQVVSLKEDVSRKNKIISALKEAKVSDANALEQWKNEAKLLDDHVKRLQRTLQAKENVVATLRSKCETLESQLEKLSGVAGDTLPLPPSHKEVSPGGGDTGDNNNNNNVSRTGDLYLLSTQELRQRLKEYDLERARYRARLQACRDKLQELETQLVQTKDENQELQRQQEKLVELKSIVSRKEHLIVSLRQQLEAKDKGLVSRHQQELALRQESEKRIKSLQRQVDAALRHQQDLEKETLFLRQRVTQSVGHEQWQEMTQRATHNQYFNNNNSSNSSSGNAQKMKPSTGGAFHFSVQGQQAPFVSPSPATRMHRAVALQNNNNNASATQRLSDVSRSLLPTDNTLLFPSHITSDDDSDSNLLPPQNNGNMNNNNINNNNNNNVRGNDVESLLMQTLGLNPANNNTNNNNNYNNLTQESSQSVSQTTDLLSRLTGLAHILPPSYSNSSQQMQNNAPASQTDSPSAVNLSNASSGNSHDTSDSSTLDALTSAEKRLQALVDAALKSPPRR